jgi:hypothetical protein
MRTLNRPMFRYGGPIKEGVMNGIREPKRNGGLMTQRVQPSNDGSRPGYAGPLLAAPVIGAGIMTAARAGLRYIPRGINYLKNLGRTRTGSTTTTVPKQGPTFPGTSTTKQGGFGAPVTTRSNPVGTGSGTIETPTYAPNFLGRDPLIRAGGKIISAVTNPAVTGKLAGAARLVFSPSGAVIGGLYYANGKFFNKKGEEAPPPPEGSTLGDTVDIKGGGADTEAVKRSPEEIKAAEAKARMEKMESYKEIMDIKGMSKDAAYKSLIDASQIIADNGNLKEGIKDGSLIARLTGAASKRFDKVGDTETALRSLVAKGEIENEMNKEAKALARRKDELAIKTYEKSLSGDSFDEAILKSLTGTGGKMPTGNKLAGLLKATRGIDAVVLDGSQISKPGSEIAFIENQVIEGKKKGNPIPQGAYVINSTIVVIDEQGNVKKYY